MFVSPYLLFGIAAIASPIIIHLLNSRKVKRVVWAAMRFVELSLQKNRRRMQIEDLLLLILRCAMLVLLAVALARPIMRGGASILGDSPVTAVILLDNSGSMGKAMAGTTRFELAKQAADELVARLPRGSSAELLLVSDIVEEAVVTPSLDLAAMRQHIRAAQVSDRATNFFAGLQQAYRSLAPIAGAGKVVYLITDGQTLGWRQGQADGNSQELFHLLDSQKEAVNTRVVLVTDNDTRNSSISDIQLSTDLATIDKPLQFDVTVRNFNAEAMRDVPVRLFVDEQADPVDQAVIDQIAPNAARSISLHTRFATAGYHAVRAQIPNDAMPSDNERAMVARIWHQVQVLLVNGEAGHTAREEDTFFVRQALTAVEPERRAGYVIQTRTISADELEQTSLEPYDAIVMANVSELTRPAVATLERIVGEGRGLMIFTGPRVNTSFYRDVLYQQHGLLPAGLGEPTGDADQGDRFESLKTTDMAHAIMAPLDDQRNGGPLGPARFFRMHELQVKVPTATWPVSDNPPGPTAIVATYSNGKPAMVEHSFGQGRVVLFGSSANTAWNDMPVRAALFVPLIQRTLDSLLHRQEEQLNLRVGQKLALRCRGDLWGKDAQITPPERAGRPVASRQVDTVEGWPMLLFEETGTAGIYQLELDPAAMMPPVFAVQANAAESNLQELGEAEIEELKTHASCMRWKPGASWHDQERPEHGVEWWRPLAGAVLAIMLVETFLAYWGSRVK